MKTKLIVLIGLLCSLQTIIAQNFVTEQEKYTEKNKGKFFISWGGNRESYSKSDITFKGDGYNFTLNNVKADDKPKGYHLDYLNPARMTIPQTNLKIGYFFSDKYNISIGLDHMKYVMRQDQVVNMTGTIDGYGEFDGTYHNTPTVLDENFLMFEHTDGLNYIYAEIARFDDISKWFGITNTDLFQINITEGIGGGIILPKTNTTLMNKKRYDEFHLSGYGISAKAAINFTFFKHFYIQGELKGGYINLPDIRTTSSKTDSAKQDFTFFQRIISVGGIFRV